ncbi:hypothetical protein [Streptococcus sp. LYSM12]|nr:hypothetical protein [Streptococcus sp. LYSM12]MCQ9214291.1 hypothetical protein [Streptococcus sp. O1]
MPLRLIAHIVAFFLLGTSPEKQTILPVKNHSLQFLERHEKFSKKMLLG